jgi:hypothetical protein
MSKLDKLYPSKYLQSSDLNGKSVTVKIDRVALEEVGQKKEWKPVIYFMRAKKAMVLNVTNARMIESAYGDDYENAWHGKAVILTVEKVSFQGKVTDGLRIHIPKQARDEPAIVGGGLLKEEPPLPGDDDEPAMLEETENVFE